MFMNTDAQWKRFGIEEPYFGVLSDSRYLRQWMTEETRREFFTSGESHVSFVMRSIEQYIRRPFRPAKVLDFGCGVGRLLIPLARRSELVHGVDISEAMLIEAKNNCAAAGLRNFSVALADDSWFVRPERYDLVHSYIVFQHIPPHRGERLFAKLLSLLSADGVAVIHVTFAAPKGGKVISWVKSHVPLARNIVNIIRGRNFFCPTMSMYTYNMGRLMRIAVEHGVEQAFLSTTNHGGYLGAILFLQRKADQL